MPDPSLPDAAQALLDRAEVAIDKPYLQDRLAHLDLIVDLSAALRAALAATSPDDDDEQDVKITYLSVADVDSARQATEIQAAASPDDEAHAFCVTAEQYEEALRRADEASISSIVARNPGIDEDEVRAHFHRQAAATPPAPTDDDRYTAIEPRDGSAVCILDGGVLAMRVYGGFNVQEILDRLNRADVDHATGQEDPDA